MGGNLLGAIVGAWVIGSPLVYFVFRVAALQKRPPVLWGIIALFAGIPFGLVFNSSSSETFSTFSGLGPLIPFLILALWPLKGSTDQVMRIRFPIGWVILLVVAFGAIILVYSQSSPPSLKSVWMRLASYMEIATYLSLLAILAYGLVETHKRLPTSTLTPSLQLIGIVGLILAIFYRALGAHQAWGRMETFDAKETWAFIQLYVMVGTYVHLIRPMGWKTRRWIIVVFQTAISTFALLSSVVLPSLYASSFLYSKAARF